MPTKKIGRPTKYRKDYCQRLIAHMSKGKSFESFGAVAKVSKQTLYDWTVAHPEFLDAKSVGTTASLDWWEDAGIDGMTERVFNSAVWIFNMKNRFGWRDQPSEARDDTPQAIEIKLVQPEKPAL